MCNRGKKSSAPVLPDEGFPRCAKRSPSTSSFPSVRPDASRGLLIHGRCRVLFAAIVMDVLHIMDCKHGRCAALCSEAGPMYQGARARPRSGRALPDASIGSGNHRRGGGIRVPRDYPISASSSLAFSYGRMDGRGGGGGLKGFPRYRNDRDPAATDGSENRLFNVGK